MLQPAVKLKERKSMGEHPSLMVWINKENVGKTSLLVSQCRLQGFSYDLEIFPPKDDPPERQLAFFTAMVAIDHRTSTLYPFEAWIAGKRYKGSDLLFRLGIEVYRREPDFYTPENLSKLDKLKALKLLSYHGMVMWDLHVRTLLLRDLGSKILHRYESYSKLLDVETVTELLNRLSWFRAYEDPVAKKSFLLAKFLHKRGLKTFKDEENFQVPVDNHLTRIAIRLGIIELEDYTIIDKQLELSRSQDIALRMKVREAWKEVSKASGTDPFTLDDFLWVHGRTVCLPGNPRCEDCILKSACRSFETGYFPNEHRHSLTWYY